MANIDGEHHPEKLIISLSLFGHEWRTLFLTDLSIELLKVDI